MRMDEIGYHHKHDSTFCVDRPNGAGDWLFLFIKTPAIFRVDGVDIVVQENSFILYTPEYPEHYGAAPDCSEYINDWIFFCPDDDELQLKWESSYSRYIDDKFTYSICLALIVFGAIFIYNRLNGNLPNIVTLIKEFSTY